MRTTNIFAKELSAGYEIVERGAGKLKRQRYLICELHIERRGVEAVVYRPDGPGFYRRKYRRTDSVEVVAE